MTTESVTGLLRAHRDSEAPSHIDEAVNEYGFRYMVMDGRSYAPGALFRSAGLPHPLPHPVNRLVASGDFWNERAIPIPRSAGFERQWNPYSGTWYVASALPDPKDHRFLSKHFERATELLFMATHELVHANIASVLLGGLLGRLDLAGLEALHQVCEAVAVLVGDLEVPAALEASGYLARFWPPATQFTHANDLNPVAALRAAGLASSEDRAAWIRHLYLEGGTDLPILPIAFADRAVSLSMLFEEHAYATRMAREVLPAWRAYWAAPELRSFIREFVPPSASVTFDGEGRTILIEDAASVFQHWRPLSIDWCPPPPEQAPYLRARVEIQRVGLRVAELLKAVRSPRWLATDEHRLHATARIDRAWREALALFHPLRANLGSMTRDEGEDRIREARAVLTSLREDVWNLAGKDAWHFVHPAVTGESMDDRPAAARLPNHATASPGDLCEIAQLIDVEAAAYHLSTGDEDAAVLAADAHGLAVRLAGPAPREEDVALARAFVRDVVDSRRLKHAYPLAWIDERPFVEPSVGFRFS
jgi:hypothetical protein